jgi:hypothetical protein
MGLKLIYVTEMSFIRKRFTAFERVIIFTPSDNFMTAIRRRNRCPCCELTNFVWFGK